jgi:hypothetical protein
VVTPAVTWCASDTRSTPEKALSEKIELKLKSLAAESKFGSPVWSRNGVLTYSSARLQRLAQRAAEQRGLALEEPARRRR